MSAIASVTPETKVYSIEVPALQAALAQNPDIAARVQRNLLRRLSTRLRAATEAITCILHAMETKG